MPYVTKLVKDCYYIVDISILNRPKVHRYAFLDEETAIRGIDQNFKGNYRNYQVLHYNEIIKHRIPLEVTRKDKYGRVSPTKYDYPIDRLPQSQKRKTYRTVQRRKLKRRLRKLNNNT